MAGEHPFYLEYHARAFSELWSVLDVTLRDLSVAYRVSSDDSVDDYEEKFFMGLFVEAAGSHIQVVTACTLLESLIAKEFEQYGKWFKRLGDPNHPRWLASDECSFNPRVVVKPNGEIKDRNNFIDGHIQLCEACGIAGYLDEDFKSFLRTMLFYRNYIVHNGLEWGERKVQDFKSKVGKRLIAEYFTKSTAGGSDWVYAAKPETIAKLRHHVSQMITDLDEMFWSAMFSVDGLKRMARLGGVPTVKEAE